MEATAYASAIAACVAVVVTLALYWYSVHRETQASAKRNRDAMVERVIATGETYVRKIARGPLQSRSAQLELALLLPRLVSELPAEDGAVARWVARQVQLVSAQPTSKRAVRESVNITSKLIEWKQGKAETAWFVEANQRDPFDAGYRPTLSVRLRQAGEVAGHSAVYTAAGMTVLLAGWTSIRAWRADLNKQGEGAQ